MGVGQDVYVPFWVLLDYDPAPHDPFRCCRVVGLRLDDGLQVADLEVATAMDGPPLIAYGVPLDRLITPAELPSWVQRLADWFLSYKG